jgi:hypothetical protein
MEQEFALWRGGVHLLGQRAERHPAFLQAIHCREQVRQRSPETVEFPHHETIARLEEGQSLCKAGTIVAAAAGAIFEQMPLIDPRRQQGIALQIHYLAIAIGRHAHISDQHVRKSLIDWFPHTTPFRQGLPHMF